MMTRDGCLLLLSFQSHDDYPINSDNFTSRAVINAPLQLLVADAQRSHDLPRLLLHRMERPE